MAISKNPLTQEFDDIFEKHLSKDLPHHLAYLEAEKEFKEKYNHNKYSSFESYRISRSNRIKQKRN